MKFDKIIPVLSGLAPTIATSLGGPLAGMGVSVLMKALGLDESKAQTPEGEAELTKAVLGMSPETAAAVRKADQDFQVKMRELDIDVDKLAYDDRAGARAMQTATRDWTPRAIGFGVVVGLFVLLALMTFKDLPNANHDALTLLLGTLASAFGSVVAFYFGSSAGSQAKDQTIKELKK